MNKEMFIELLTCDGDLIGFSMHAKGSDNFRNVLTEVCAKESNHALIIFRCDGKEGRFWKRGNGAIMFLQTGKSVSIDEVLALIA